MPTYEMFSHEGNRRVDSAINSAFSGQIKLTEGKVDLLVSRIQNDVGGEAHDTAVREAIWAEVERRFERQETVFYVKR